MIRFQISHNNDYIIFTYSLNKTKEMRIKKGKFGEHVMIYTNTACIKRECVNKSYISKVYL